MKCGVGDYCYNLAKSIAAADVRVAILTSEFGRATAPNDKVEVFSVIKKWRLIETIKVIKVIYRWSPDVVHIQYPTQGYGRGFLPYMLPMILFFMGKKVVQTWHEECNKWRSGVQLFFKAIVPDVVVTLYPSYKKLLPPILRCALWLKKIVIIPIASNIPVIEMSEDRKNALKQTYLKKQTRLIVFFGFLYPPKGVELLFEITDPASDYIVIAGEFGHAKDYNQKITELASTSPWVDKVTVTGFLFPDNISELLTVADAVILPFRRGRGEFNRGSVYAAIAHKTFVITTSMARNGYDQKHNIYYAKVDDIQEMKSALCNYAGRRREKDAEIDKDKWQDIANKHVYVYKQIVQKIKRRHNA
ncbi:MAG: glycosyltransferase [Planctomycetota bacterium]|jgi:glycosyltransferase involved in cell wall biosynthesis